MEGLLGKAAELSRAQIQAALKSAPVLQDARNGAAAIEGLLGDAAEMSAQSILLLQNAGSDATAMEGL